MGLLELARSLRASRFQIFMKVQFPAALPFVFAGAKVAVTLAVIGAVIGEFVGSVGGLGNLLLTANSQLDTSLAWASLVWLSVLNFTVCGSRWGRTYHYALGRKRASLIVLCAAVWIRKRSFGKLA